VLAFRIVLRLGRRLVGSGNSDGPHRANNSQIIELHDVLAEMRPRPCVLRRRSLALTPLRNALSAILLTPFDSAALAHRSAIQFLHAAAEAVQVVLVFDPGFRARWEAL